jgi:hypothetical protein
MRNRKIVTTVDKNGIEQKEIVEVEHEEQPDYKAYAIVREPSGLFVLRTLEMSENGYILKSVDSDPDLRAVQMGKIMIELENYD